MFRPTWGFNFGQPPPGEGTAIFAADCLKCIPGAGVEPRSDCCALLPTPCALPCMKPLHWDAINPITGTPFTWDDPNLFWGDPSYYLEPGDPGFVPYPGMTPAPKPKKKTFHRKRKPITPANPEPQPVIHTMSTFKYNIAPLAAGGFTTRAVRGAQADQTAIAAAIATTTGVTPEQVETVIQTFFDKILSCAAGCDWSPNFFGCISLRPTSGGSQAAPDAFHNADDINADVAISLSAEKIRTWRAGLSLESLAAC